MSLITQMIITLTNYAVNNNVFGLGHSNDTFLNWLQLKDKEMYELVMQLTDDNFTYVLNEVRNNYCGN